MNQETTIEIAVAFELLTCCSHEHENHTFDNLPVDEKYHESIRHICTTMCLHVEYRDDATRQLRIARLIQYVHDNIACHDRDDDVAMINDICNIIDTYMPTKFEHGMCDDGEFEGLYVLPLAECLLNSSWDFASFVQTLGLDDLTDIHPDTMHPTREHVVMIADVIDLADDERDTFINDFPLDWDT